MMMSVDLFFGAYKVNSVSSGKQLQDRPQRQAADLDFACEQIYTKRG
jgi:hypothetical protein